MLTSSTYRSATRRKLECFLRTRLAAHEARLIATGVPVQVQEFMKKCQEVSFKVLSCFALGLGFEGDFFTKVSFCCFIKQYKANRM